MDKIKSLNIFLFIVILSGTLLQGKSNNLLIDSENNTPAITTVKTENIHIDSKYNSSNFKNKLRDYDGTLFENMFIYGIDIVVPDEIFKATESILNHRKNQDIDVNTQERLKMFFQDSYNVFLTTGYYYMQDIANITEQVWSSTLCSSNMFVYREDKNPIYISDDLKKEDENARGVSSRGVILPKNDNFPKAYYPYASKPNGCSIGELQYIYNAVDMFSNNDQYFDKACDKHDKCYYTIGSTYQECNDAFIVNITDACHHIDKQNTMMTLGVQNTSCGVKALVIATAVNLCEREYFKRAQYKQRKYNQWVDTYEKAYLKDKGKKNTNRH